MLDERARGASPTQPLVVDRHALDAVWDGIFRVRRAPALVGVQRRSVYGPGAEDRAIAQAVQAQRGVDVPLPVVFGGKIIGVVQGHGFGDPRVTYRALGPEYRRYHCGFTSYDALINAITNNGARLPTTFSKTCTTAVVANNWYDLWPVGGNPSAGAYGGAAFTAVQKSDTTTGAMFCGGNVSPSTKHCLQMTLISTASTPMLWMYDRVLTYEACTFNANANQVFTNTLPAQRYISAGQSGMKIMTTAQTVGNATAANITQLRYTNQSGTTLQVMPQTPVPAIIVSAAAPTATLGARVIAPATTAATLPWGPFLPLAAGDGGAQLINDWTTSAAQGAQVCFVLARPLFSIPIATAGVGSQVDGVMQVANLERIFDGACLAFLTYHLATTALTLLGELDVAWG